MSTNLNRRFEIDRQELEERIQQNLGSNHQEYHWVVPLRDIVVVEEMRFVRQELLESLIRAIPLRDREETVHPYAKATITMYGIEPKGLAIGQTFVSKEKVLAIMSSMSRVFDAYMTKGLSKMPPAQLLGEDAEGRRVMALYIPPIVEQQQGQAVLLDGIHRSYICSSAGTTINCVTLGNIATPLPFDPITWKDAQLVDEKPPIDQRYRNLQPRYFRDLTMVGIDG